MKKIITFTFLFVLCVLLALWSPWLYWKIDVQSLFGIKKPEAISGLQVFSLSGELNVLLDNQQVGTVKVETSPFIVDKVNPGQHLVTLVRKSDSANSYWSFSRLLTFEQGSSVVVSYNLGPEEEFSEGHVIYAVKKTDTTKPTKLNINVNTPDITLQMDSIQPQKITGSTYTTVLSMDAQHKLKISKAGFESLEMTILPDSQSDRDKLKDYDLNMDVELMYQPIQVN